MSNQQETNKETNKETNNEINQRELNQTQLNQIKKLLICSLCNDILLEPVTLYCQDTFCNHCLELLEENSLVQCPKCNQKGLLVPTHNYKIKEIIEKVFTKEQLEAREKRYQEMVSKKGNNQKATTSRELEIKRQIRKEVWHNEINKSKSNNNGNNLMGDNLFLPLNF